MPSKVIRKAETHRKTRLYLTIGALALVILLVTLGTAGRQQTLRCERLESGEVDCIAKQSILGVIPLNEKSIPGARAASIAQQCPEVKCTYRLEIYSIQGLVPVDEKYTADYERQLKVKEQINDFFKDESSPSITMQEKTNPIIISAIVVAFLLIWGYLGFLIWQAHQPEVRE
jgi:hypothetical protein